MDSFQNFPGNFEFSNLDDNGYPLTSFEDEDSATIEISMDSLSCLLKSNFQDERAESASAKLSTLVQPTDLRTKRQENNCSPGTSKISNSDFGSDAALAQGKEAFAPGKQEFWSGQEKVPASRMKLITQDKILQFLETSFDITATSNFSIKNPNPPTALSSKFNTPVSKIMFSNDNQEQQAQRNEAGLSQSSSTSVKINKNLSSRGTSKFQKNGKNTSAGLLDLDVQDGYVAEEKKIYLQKIFPCFEPYNFELISIAKRILTFEYQWAIDTSMNINEMAEAGFYYLGSSEVQCWYCGVVIGGWTKNLSAWKEHARMAPSCSYLLRNRGVTFVEEVLSQENDKQLTSEPANQSQTQKNTLDIPTCVQSGPEWTETVSNSSPPDEEEKRCILSECMSSDIVQKALKFFSECDVRHVLKRQISRHFCGFQTFEALYEALQESSIDFNDSYANEEQPVIIPSERDTTLQTTRRGATSQPTGDSEESILEPSIDLSSAGHIFQAAEKEKKIHKALQQTQFAKCMICLDQEACVLFQSCSHVCACVVCTQNLKTCPKCGTKVQSPIKVLRS